MTQQPQFKFKHFKNFYYLLMPQLRKYISIYI